MEIFLFFLVVFFGIVYFIRLSNKAVQRVDSVDNDAIFASVARSIYNTVRRNCLKEHTEYEHGAISCVYIMDIDKKIVYILYRVTPFVGGCPTGYDDIKITSFKYSDVIKVDMVIDSSTICTVDRSELVAGAIIGGVVGGGVGAVIGAMSAHSNLRGDTKSIHIEVFTSNAKRPRHRLNFSVNRTRNLKYIEDVACSWSALLYSWMHDSAMGLCKEQSIKMKVCRFCAEDIRFEAIVCRYCGRDVS